MKQRARDWSVFRRRARHTSETPRHRARAARLDARACTCAGHCLRCDCSRAPCCFKNKLFSLSKALSDVSTPLLRALCLQAGPPACLWPFFQSGLMQPGHSLATACQANCRRAVRQPPLLATKRPFSARASRKPRWQVRRLHQGLLVKSDAPCATARAAQRT